MINLSKFVLKFNEISYVKMNVRTSLLIFSFTFQFDMKKTIVVSKSQIKKSYESMLVANKVAKASHKTLCPL